MKRKQFRPAKKLMISKNTIAALSGLQSGNIIGGKNSGGANTHCLSVCEHQTCVKACTSSLCATITIETCNCPE